MDRRLFLSAMGSALLLPSRLYADQSNHIVIGHNGRALNLERAHSGERISVVYQRDGQLNKQAVLQVCRLLRDTKADKAAMIDVRLLDILDSIRVALMQVGEKNPVFTVHSAFRTWQTNREAGGALKSYHMRGMAVDFHVKGIPTDILFTWMKAVKFHGGIGMGFYGGNPTWMHLDSRRVDKNIVWTG